MQYFNAIHCDRNISTFELKKSVCCQSADPRITADLRPQSAVRTPRSAPAVSGKAINSTGLGQQ